MCQYCLDLIGLLRMSLMALASMRDAIYPPEVRQITPQQLIDRPETSDAAREWLRLYAADPNFAPANNPPGFITNEGCWERAKRAADHAGASDPWAFATWWYQEHC